jgi:methyl-accepting chemotaxis protein
MLKMTVKNRLILAFLAILIIPGSAIGWFSYQSAAKQVASQIEKNAAQSVEFTNSQINDLMSSSLIAG